MPTTREIIEAALEHPMRPKLLPGLSVDELEELSRAMPIPPAPQIRELLAFCSGVEGPLELIDFSGRTFDDAFGPEYFPDCIPIAHDGSGNFWIIDPQPENPDWGPIYYCCHDEPVILLQSQNLQEFMSEVFKKYFPPHKSLIEDVHEDRLFQVGRTNPGVITHADALASTDLDIRSFANNLDPGFSLIDLRGAAIGMGFSWGRYGPRTEVRRFGSKPIFAYKKPEKTGFFSKLFGS